MAWKLGAQIRIRSISAGGMLACPISAEVKEIDWHRDGQTKMADSSIRMCVCVCVFVVVVVVVCLYCTKSKLSATAERRNNHPRSRSLSPSSYRTPFYLSRRSNIEASAIELTWRKHPVERHAGDGKHHVAFRCGTPRRESDRKLSQPGVAKLRVAATKEE